MTMSDVASIVFVVLAALIAMPCIALVYGVFLPNFARKAEARVTRNPIATFFTGLVVGGVVFGLAAAMAQGPAGFKFLSAVIALGGGWMALSGLAGIAGRIGHATPSPVDRERPWRAMVRGAVILELACLFPIIGWLLIYPIAIVTGIGAATLAIFPASSAQPVPQYVPPAVPAAPAAAQPAFSMAGPEEVMHR
ncbi:MAG: hypothetical protein K8T20_07555 [Planctomycetes bacterium]|nr:hypothetical protein [Planctomycetota bacterium]